MERIRTKLIIAVTNRLSAAADTNAKTELIEELSENLYQRYLDLLSQGVGEEEAYQRALDDLGDVDELLAYLGSLGPDGELPPNQEEAGRHFYDDFSRYMEGIVRETIHQTKDAVHQAKAIVRGVADKIREKYPDGFKGRVYVRFDNDSGDAAQGGDESGGWSFSAGYNEERGGFFCGSNQSRRVEGTSFPSAALRAIDIGLVNGDVAVHLDGDPHADVALSGDTEELELRLSDDGRLLTVRQGNTASSSFFFGRGLAVADVELTVPRRLWESIHVETANGDVEVDDGLEAGRLAVKTASGDLELSGAACGQLVFRSASGDLDCQNFTGDIQADTASGDVTLGGAFGAVKVNTASGDVSVCGNARELRCASMSGDVEIETAETPQALELSSKSGDCEVAMPGNEGFTLRFSTVTGSLDSGFPLAGPDGARSGEAVYLDGGGRTFHISTVSGDISLRKI